MSLSIFKNLKNEFYKYRTLILVLFVFFMAAAFSFFATHDTDSSVAVSTSGFNPGNIISDAVMSDYNSMSVADIQAFLTSKNGCNNTNYALYLDQTSRYENVTWHWSGEPYNGHFVCLSEERFGDGTEIGSGQTAAEIIYGAAQANHINPKVLIVLLEKEQGLITDTYPHSNQYRSATGYGCPDTAACDSKYYGFKNQVYRAAELFRYTLDNGYYAYPEKKSGVYVGYHPNSSCGRSEVYIENRATSALYRYTPYQPNSASLAAGFGTGDSCSSYGNRNFYLYYTQWFGSTQVLVDGKTIDIPNGEYSFVSQLSSSYALGIASGNGNNTNVQTVKYNSSDPRQKWLVEKTHDGYYQLTNVATNKALDANTSDQAGIYNNIRLWDRNGTCSQKWKIYSVGNGQSLTFESACMPGVTIDLYGGSAYDGANISTWLSNGMNAQKWNLRVGRTLEDGLYTISLSGAKDKVVDLANNSNVTIWDNHGGSNQSWFLQYEQDTDTYKIINPATRKVVDVAGLRMENNNNVATWSQNNGCNQKWKLLPKNDGSGKYNVISYCSLEYAMDLYGGYTSNGTNIQLWQSYGGVSQEWTFNPQTLIDTDGIYNIVSKNSSSAVIDLNISNNYSNGSNVTIWGGNGGDNQRWQFVYNSDTKDYRIINPLSGKALNLSGTATVNANIDAWDYQGSCNQRWKISPTVDGYYQILSACNNNYALDIFGGSTSNGSNIQLFDRHDKDNQKFSLVKR